MKTTAMGLMWVAMTTACGEPGGGGAATDGTDATDGSDLIPLDGDVADVPATPESVERRLAGKLCASLARCYPYEIPGDRLIPMLRESSPEACSDFLIRLGWNGSLDAAVASLEVDEAALEACIADLDDRCVDDAASLCADAFVGTVTAGGSCVVDASCEGDAYCGEDGCARACYARRQRGSECAYDRQCSQAAGPTVCGPDSSECRPYRAPGAAVAAGERCGTLESELDVTYVPCAAGLVCINDVCRARVAAGSECDWDAPCAPGNRCVIVDFESGAGKCFPYTIVSSAGAACQEDEERPENLAFCNEAERLGCRDGQCVRAGNGSVGSACFQAHVLPCEDGAYCGDDDRCAARKPNGLACEDDRECATDYCDFDGVCAELAVCE